MKAAVAWSIATLIAMVVGGVIQLAAGGDAARQVWMAGLIVCAAPVLFDTIRDARHGQFATDIVAALAIVGAILLGATVAGLVVVLMRQGGQALERFAEGRASHAVRELEAAAPRQAHRLDGEHIVDVDAGAIAAGDMLVVRPGELIPCDGVVEGGASDVDTSAITGEPVAIGAAPGTRLLSGYLNGSGVLRMRSTAPAAESQYARIVELVRTAQSHKAPLQRMADRYAVWFTPLTLIVCAIAYAVSRDWTRVLAVLVVATPCPLILATPVAFVGGINRAARQHVIVRNAAALEALSRVNVLLLDKTGTITLGEPRLERIRPVEPWGEEPILRLVASVEQGSGHRIGRAVVASARARGLRLAPPRDLHEAAGSGVSATVEGHDLRLGSRGFVLADSRVDAETLEAVESGPALLRTYVSVDGASAATLEFAEELRPDALSMIEQVRGAGIEHVALLSGDHADNVRAMAARTGIVDVRGDLLPADKAAIVGDYERAGKVVMMVGDGTNDAPALTAASVGVALAGHGGGVTAEAADAIVLRDSLEAVAQALDIGRDTTRIARQSIGVGLALSAAAMVWAAAGGIAPIAGALMQEAIDVAVILNALRAIRGTP
jgi:heavy metal translocating P-type ATPase